VGWLLGHSARLAGLLFLFFFFFFLNQNIFKDLFEGVN